MNDDDQKLGERYVEIWVHAFQVFAGYPRSFVLEWTRPLADFMAHHPNTFFHETAMDYVAELLVPPRLASSLHPYDLMDLEGKIFDVIDPADTTPDFDWEAAKDQVEQILNEYGGSLSSLRERLK